MYKNILVLMDGSELAESILPHVTTVARGCEEPELTLLRVVEPIELPYVDSLNAAGFNQLKQAEINEKEKAQKYLNKIATKLTISGIKTSTKIIPGRPADTIVDYVNNNKIDLVILATHGRSGISRWIWGSVADRVLRHVCVAVLMVRAPGCGMHYK